MKILICTLNSKYIHSSLAPWCLYTACKAYCKADNTFTLKEGTINEKSSEVLERILKEEPDLIAFSCYIWNKNKLLDLCKEIKEKCPHVIIALGGPEAAYCQRELLEGYPFIDYILSGEGEIVLPTLIDCINNKEEAENLNGVSFCKNGKYIIKNEVIGEAFDYPSPYCEEYFSQLGGRIAYIESSRGCPFSCAYCLSGRCGKVKFRSLESTKKEILALASSGAKTVKFIDRTFNCDNTRATEILRFIRENRGTAIPYEVCFHFEISADILKESFIEEVALAKRGELQFEVGIQSLKAETLEAIGRKSNKEKLFSNLSALIKLGNCHIHTDLIAGLPYETAESFIDGFNECYKLGAAMLQLGFLKMLHGSALRESSFCFFNENPPYEVISTPTMSEADLEMLRTAEKEVDRLHNSGRFPRTLEYILEKSGLAPFELFYTVGKSITEESMPLDTYTDRLYSLLSGIEGIDKKRLRDLMLYDRITFNNSGIIPKSLFVNDPKLKKAKHILSLEYPMKKGTNRSVAILYSEKKVIFCDYDVRDRLDGSYCVKELTFDFFGETFFDFDIDK